jgi:hypothetical protein
MQATSCSKRPYRATRSFRACKASYRVFMTSSATGCGVACDCRARWHDLVVLTFGRRYASPSFHRKQIRHWSFTRTLCCPLRSPRSFSSRFPGGTNRSASDWAASSNTNLRSMTRWRSAGYRRTRSRANKRAVSLSPNALITDNHNARRVITRKSGRQAQAIAVSSGPRDQTIAWRVTTSSP